MRRTGLRAQLPPTSTLRARESLTCSRCGEPLCRAGYIECRRCYSGARPTRVRVAAQSLGLTLAEVAERARVGHRTAIRAAQGRPLSLRVARRLHALLGVDIGHLVVGEDATDQSTPRRTTTRGRHGR